MKWKRKTTFLGLLLLGLCFAIKNERKSSWRGEEDETAKKQKGKANLFRDFH